MKKRMNISDVIIQSSFKKAKPSENKMNKCREFFKKHGYVDKKILVNKDNTLLDGYIRYLVLKENNISDIEVEKLETNTYHPMTTYVYGVHHANNKEFVWRVPKSFKTPEKIVPGSKILVCTSKGIKKIEVTKVEILNTPPIDIPIKKVFRCIE